MKQTILILLLLTETYAQESHQTKTYSMEQLKGTWNYFYEDNDTDSSMVISGTNTYSLNGTLISKGSIKFFNADKKLSAKTNIIMHDEWSIEGNKLIEQVIECQFDYIKKSKDDFIVMMMDIVLKSMCNAQLKTTSDILDISPEEFTTRDLNETQVYTKVK